VIEVIALDSDTERRLWQWLTRMDLVVTLAAVRGPVPHPLQLLVQEPRRLGVTVNDALWLRLLDVPAALAARTYAHEGRLTLELADAMIDSNAGRWQITVRADGPADVGMTTAEPDLALDVATRASAYLGTFRFVDLGAAGRIRELTPGALQRADTLFTPPRAPYSNTFF
jgi:predicted acetyltransferase